MATAPTYATPTVEEQPLIRRVSWGAILVGLVIALAIQALLATLGLALGFGSITPSEEVRQISGLGTGAGVWGLSSSIISLFIGGWAAGRLAGLMPRPAAVLHGLAVWGIALIVSLWLATTAVAWAISGAAGAAGQVMQMSGSALAAAVPSVDSLGVQGALSRQRYSLDAALGEVRQLMRQAGVNPQVAQQQAERMAEDIAMNPQQALAEVEPRVMSLYARSELPDADRQRLVELIANNTGLSE